MTSSNPPYPYFNGIKYNSLFFTSSSAGLSQAQANALYLQKTVPDAASAIETFKSGILTNSIEAFNNLSPLNIGTLTTGAMNIGRTGNISSILGSVIIPGLLNVGGTVDVSTSLSSLNLCTNSNGLINIGTSSTRTANITVCCLRHHLQG